MGGEIELAIVAASGDTARQVEAIPTTEEGVGAEDSVG